MERPPPTPPPRVPQKASDVAVTQFILLLKVLFCGCSQTRTESLLFKKTEANGHTAPILGPVWDSSRTPVEATQPTALLATGWRCQPGTAWLLCACVRVYVCVHVCAHKCVRVHVCARKCVCTGGG